MDRHFFSAQAELVELRSQMRVNTRVGDVSLQGCYLDMMNPFPPETRVRLKIIAEAEIFEAESRIAYAIPNVGGGAEFVGVQTEDQALLERWVSKGEAVSRA